jgi:hypothetical protein
MGTRAWSATVSWDSAHRRRGCADNPSIRRVWKRARGGDKALRVEETRTVDRRARRGATAVNWVETRDAIWNDASRGVMRRSDKHRRHLSASREIPWLSDFTNLRDWFFMC